MFEYEKKKAQPDKNKATLIYAFVWDVYTMYGERNHDWRQEREEIAVKRRFN